MEKEGEYCINLFRLQDQPIDIRFAVVNIDPDITESNLYQKLYEYIEETKENCFFKFKDIEFRGSDRIHDLAVHLSISNCRYVAIVLTQPGA